MHTSAYDIIIFDLGGVIINIDPPATFQALQTLFNQPITPEQLRFEDYERGLFTEEEYLHFLQQRFAPFQREDFVHAWNAMLLDIPPHRIELIQTLRKTHTIWLLSNTNHTHIVEIEKRLNTQFNTGFSTLFDRCFMSYEMKMRKPNEDIYRAVQHHLPQGEKAIFVDDNEDNVHGSIVAGLPAVLVDRDIKEIFAL